MKNTSFLLAFLSLASCSSVDDTAVSTVSCGDFTTFPKVSEVLEKRCGTLDCHGSFERPLRLYGQVGQRRLEDAGAFNFDAGAYGQYFPGGAVSLATTEAELLDNYRSVCGLEPELMTRVVTLQAAPEDLTLLRKARLIEKHKGGKVFNPGREGDLCLTTWLTQASNADAGFDLGPCTDEVSHD